MTELELIIVKTKEIYDIFEFGIIPYLEVKDVLSLYRLLRFNKLIKSDISRAISEGFEQNSSLNELLKISPTLDTEKNDQAFDFIIDKDIDKHPIYIMPYSTFTIDDMENIFLQLKNMKCCFELSSVTSMLEFPPVQGYGSTHIVKQSSEVVNSKSHLVYLAEETVVTSDSGNYLQTICPFLCNKCENIKCLCQKDGECSICNGQFCWCGEVRTCNSCSYGECHDCYIHHIFAHIPVREYRSCEICCTRYCTEEECIINLNYCSRCNEHACTACIPDGYKVCDTCQNTCCEGMMECQIYHCQDCDKFTCWECDKDKCKQCSQPFSTEDDTDTDTIQ